MSGGMDDKPIGTQLGCEDALAQTLVVLKQSDDERWRGWQRVHRYASDLNQSSC